MPEQARGGRAVGAPSSPIASSSVGDSRICSPSTTRADSWSARSPTGHTPDVAAPTGGRRRRSRRRSGRHAASSAPWRRPAASIASRSSSRLGDGRGERSRVACLLPAETVLAQLGVGSSEQGFGRDATDSRVHLREGRQRRGERHLLLEDQEEQRRRSPAAATRTRGSVALDDRREHLVLRAELARRFAGTPCSVSCRGRAMFRH